jgi:hypothetical protein
MKRISLIAVTLCAAAAMSFGANWNAKLLDASCVSSGPQRTSTQKLDKACAPTSATTNFAIQANGKTYMLDEKGNEMTAAAFKNGNIKPDNDGDVHVTVNGTAQGNTIKVDSVNGRKAHD